MSSCRGMVLFLRQLLLVMLSAPKFRWLWTWVNSINYSSSPSRMLSYWSEDDIAVFILEIDFDYQFCLCTFPPIPAHLSLQSSLQARNCGPQDTTKSFSTSL